MLSIIIPYNKNDAKNIDTMKAQLSRHVKYPYELITVGDEVKNAAIARDIGALRSKGSFLIFSDAHICLDDSINNMIATMITHPNMLVSTLYNECDFPNVTRHTGTSVVGGMYFNSKWEWMWKWPTSRDRIFIAPAACCCFFGTSRNTYNKIRFLHIDTEVTEGDEEIFIRGWNLGHPHVVNPRTLIGHYFPYWTKSFDMPDARIYHFAVSTLLNFSGEVLAMVNKDSFIRFGDKWTKAMQRAKDNWNTYACNLKKRFVPDRTIEKWFITGNDRYAPKVQI